MISSFGENCAIVSQTLVSPRESGYNRLDIILGTEWPRTPLTPISLPKRDGQKIGGLALPEFREAYMNHIPEGNREESPAALVQRLELPFKNLLLLRRALTHRSYVNEHQEALEDNERLEFLGDAVLDFVAGAWLYNHFPEMAEGELTRMRSALVCTEQLAEFARAFDLGSAMRLGHGEDQAGGRQKDVLLCATFEAVIGALYLQSDMSTIQRLVHPMLDQVSEQIILSSDSRDPKSRLQEWSQGKRLGIPKYVTVTISGPDHQRMFEIEVQINGKAYGRGSGHNKQVAERAAAQAALEAIEKP
ncbi:MAG: ribonuclease III [Anaerolineales bacterium]